MSVYIKDMEMPTSCRACHLKMNCDDCEELECVCVPLHQQIGYLDDLLTDKRRDDCPLVLVPEHGRLGDLDDFAKRMKNLVEKAENDGFDLGAAWYSAFVRHIELTHTIILADKEGER